MILDLLFPKQCLNCRKGGKYLCFKCLREVPLGGFVGNNYSVFKYQGVIRRAIISLKYKFATDISDELSDICAKNITIPKNKNFVLIPIPLHKHRENWRGFNQTEIIGEKLAKKMGWKYIPDLLIRIKNNMPQVGLKGPARRSNLTDVFIVNTNHFISNNYSLVIFDDVYTTGSTINEAKKVLQDTGFKNIKSLTIAR